MTAKVMTAEEIAAEKAKLDAHMAELEAERRKNDKVISLTGLPDGMMALTASGRLFFRTLDNRHFDGRNPQKFIWREVEGPL
jgi:hypothetical protein